MTGDMKIRDMQESDRDAVMRIFNHYAATSFAAYPDGPLPPQFFDPCGKAPYRQSCLRMTVALPGSGSSSPSSRSLSFRKTGMLTYFLAPEATGKGLGNRLLEQLILDAKKKGMTMLVANMSSKNEASIRFHKRHGFSEAGNLAGVGEKFGEPFGVLWMQRAVE